jgi:multiple sugar transport system permease protein
MKINIELMAKSEKVGYLYILPAFIYIVLMMVYPLVFNFILSFQEVNMTTLMKPTKAFIGLENYRQVITSPIFPNSLKNSLIFTVGCIFFQFTIGFALALLFSFSFPLAGPLRGALLIPLMVPQVVVSVLFKWLLSGDYGLMNELLIKLHFIKGGFAWLADPKTALAGVMLANIWIGIPFNMMILASGLTAIPPDIYEAATVDGAGPLRRFIYLTLPLLRPSILIVLTLGFIYTFRIFGLIYAMTGGGPINSTTVLPILAYKLSFRFFEFGQGAAATSILLILLFIVISAYLILTTQEESRG